jgi:hypothetical protein
MCVLVSIKVRGHVNVWKEKIATSYVSWELFVVLPFFFCMVIVWFVLIRFTASEYPFGGLQAFIDTVHSIHLNVHHMDQ